jgi:hypothetical protein
MKKNLFSWVTLLVLLVATAAGAAADTITLPAGTTLPVRLETGVSSASANVGDLVVAKTTSSVRARGETVIPAGSEVRGRVTSVQRSGRIKGRAHLAVSFDRIEVRGQEHALAATRVSARAPSRTKTDVATVAGGTVGGAVVGGFIGGKKGARIGAATGAAGGTGVVLGTKGKEVAFRAGSRRNLRLTRALSVPREITVPPLRQGY